MSHDISPKPKTNINREFREWMTLDVPVGALVPPPQSTLQRLDQLGTTFYSFLQNSGYVFDPQGDVYNFLTENGGVDMLSFDTEGEVAVVRSYKSNGEGVTLICRINSNYKRDLIKKFSEEGASLFPKNESSQ